MTTTIDSIKSFLLFPLFSTLLLFNCFNVGASFYGTTDIGAIIDMSSESGKQQRRAIEIAAQSFNENSKTHNISLHFRDSGSRSPLQAVSSAQDLIQKNKVKVIIGMDTWQEAAIVADIAQESQVPVISFSSPSLTPSPSSIRFPFLIQMSNNQTSNMNCIADIVHAHNWKNVIAIYEDDPYSTDLSGLLTLLSESLMKSNSQIEQRLILPPFLSLSDPKGLVLDELIKLLSAQSRVFILLKASLPMVIHLFREAQKVGFLGKGSVWIINDDIASMLEYSVNSSVLSSMEGTIGIKTHYSKNSRAYTQFEQKFKSKPGLHALRAYDSITIITKALEKINTSDSRMLLKTMMSSDFNGLSGKIRFKESHLVEDPMMRVIINVVNKKYKELDIWVPNLKVFKSLDGSVVWPGGLKNNTPKGWKIGSEDNPLRVMVPMNPAFENFVKEKSPGSGEYEGFSIQVFYDVIGILRDEYAGLPYEFYPFNVSYDELIQNIANQSYDVIVGDVTILAERSKVVSFTQPYTESGLSVIFPEEREETTWLFMKPFSWEMWVATGGILVYTMVIIWFLEHPLNPAFKGAWKDQLSNTLWFAFTSLFFAHREKVYSNSARVVVGTWLFLVFILTSSYTASLSSMLTVKRMKSGRDIEYIKKNKILVGCDDSSDFVYKYMVDVIQIPEDQIRKLHGENDFMDKFNKKEISALFLETPYEKVFLNKYCDYTAISAGAKFGGLGFVFQRGSPLAKDFSEGILELAQNGTLEDLEKLWLTNSSECSNNSTSSSETESLTIGDFWILFVLSASISTICFFLALLRNYLHHHHHHLHNEGVLSSIVVDTNDSVWKKALTFTNIGSLNPLARAATFGGVRHRNSSKWERISTCDDNNGNPRRTRSVELGII